MQRRKQKQISIAIAVIASRALRGEAIQILQARAGLLRGCAARNDAWI
jgi:hypothetical protein